MSKSGKIYALIIIGLSIGVFLMFGRDCQPQSVAAALIDKIKSLGAPKS